MKFRLSTDFKFYIVACMLGLCLCFSGCKEDEPLANLPPDTHLSIEKIDLSGENRLNSSVRLSWYGTDKDGYVIGYEYSINEIDWFYTTSRDSIFKFAIEPGKDTTDIYFSIRSIDDKAEMDPSPAILKIPLKNAPPSVEFEEESFPGDTTFGVVTFRWTYGDPDGQETVTKAFLRANNGNWQEIDRSVRMISLRTELPKTAGSGNANVFYSVSTKAENFLLDGWQNNGQNTLYLKVEDLAGSTSMIDTSSVFFNKKQGSDLLIISGQPTDVNAKYRAIVGAVYPVFDAIDFAADKGRNQPVFWNPTFTLLTELYDKLIFNTDQSLFANALTGQSALLLEFAAPVMQNFTDKGGKSFVTTSFPTGFDPVGIRGAFPVDSLSTTSGQAVIEKDSAIRSSKAGFPVLQPSSLLLGADPFVPTVDAFPLYTAELKKFGAWKGPNVVGAYREDQGRIKQVFFGVELYRFDKNNADLIKLFDQILNTSFNW